MKWVKKTEQLEHNGSLKGSSSFSYSEAYVGYNGNSSINMQTELLIGRVHTRDVYAISRVYLVKLLGKSVMHMSCSMV